jgi:transcription elongation GreA/GreB family factor
MSRAFVKEPDGPLAGDDQPELPRSPHPNFVTPRGLALLQARRDELREGDLEALTHLGQVERELRYLEARIGTARLVEPKDQPRDAVAFGARVTLEDENGERRDYAIVGEDEASPQEGKVSWISPLAQALTGATISELIAWRRPSGDVELEVIAIRYGDD